MELCSLLHLIPAFLSPGKRDPSGSCPSLPPTPGSAAPFPGVSAPFGMGTGAGLCSCPGVTGTAGPDVPGALQKPWDRRGSGFGFRLRFGAPSQIH